MLTKDDLDAFFVTKPSEQAIGNFLSQDLSVFGDVFSHPTGEFVVFKEYQLDQGNTVDYVVFTNRARMEVIMVEAKGADFSFLKANGDPNARIGDAAAKVKQRFSYAKQNYWKFRTDALDLWRKVQQGKRLHQAVVGRPLQIDPNKEITWSGAVIAGYERDEFEVSRKRNLLEDGNSPVIRYYTWQSFLRRIVRD